MICSQAIASRWLRLVHGGLAFWRDWAAARQQLAWRVDTLRWRHQRGARLAVLRAWLAVTAERRCVWLPDSTSSVGTRHLTHQPA